jgi:hypothetical protein
LASRSAAGLVLFTNAIGQTMAAGNPLTRSTLALDVADWLRGTD